GPTRSARPIGDTPGQSASARFWLITADSGARGGSSPRSRPSTGVSPSICRNPGPTVDIGATSGTRLASPAVLTATSCHQPLGTPAAYETSRAEGTLRSRSATRFNSATLRSGVAVAPAVFT